MLRKLLKKKQQASTLDLNSNTCGVRNFLVSKGKKSKAEKLVLKSLFESCRFMGNTNLLFSLTLLELSFVNICPNIDIKNVKFRRKKTAIPHLISVDKKRKVGVK